MNHNPTLEYNNTITRIANTLVKVNPGENMIQSEYLLHILITLLAPKDNKSHA